MKYRKSAPILTFRHLLRELEASPVIWQSGRRTRVISGWRRRALLVWLKSGMFYEARLRNTGGIK